MAIGNSKDLTHVVRTTAQWKNTYDRLEIVPEGVLCVEQTASNQTLIKIGDGHKTFSDLPYVGGQSVQDYYTKREIEEKITEIISANMVFTIKGILNDISSLPSNAKSGDVWFVLNRSSSSSNQRYIEYVYSPNHQWEAIGGTPVDINLSEYAKKDYVDGEIESVKSRLASIENSGGSQHSHANKDILDSITEIFTSEEKEKLRTLYNYDDSALRALIAAANHTHSNQEILDSIDAIFTKEDRIKLDKLSTNSDSVLKEKITALEKLAHEHSNKRILDRTTASFTVAYEQRMKFIREYTGCTVDEEGIMGLVPPAQPGEEDYVLSGSGNWIPMEGGSGDGTFELTPATTSKLGGIIVGNGLIVDRYGILSVDGSIGGGDSCDCDNVGRFDRTVDATKHGEIFNVYSGNDINKAIGTATHAEGNHTVASGDYSHAEGWYNTASGTASHVEGQSVTASGMFAHAEGQMGSASGEASHKEGYGGQASGNYSHAEGNSTEAAGLYAHAEGTETYAAYGSHAEGHETTAGDLDNNKRYAHAEGDQTEATGEASHSEGNYTHATGDWSHAEGQYTHATNYEAHAEGHETYATGQYSHSEGHGTKASGQSAHAEGNATQASGNYTHAEGFNVNATATGSHAEGYGGRALSDALPNFSPSTSKEDIIAAWGTSSSDGFTLANGDGSHAEGYHTLALDNNAHAEGNATHATGIGSHSEGHVTKAGGAAAHAEGDQTNAKGDASHTEGYNTTAIGQYAHAEGNGTTADGSNHAEGNSTYTLYDAIPAYNVFSTSNEAIIAAWGSKKFTLAKKNGSHAEGQNTLAIGQASHTEGYQSIASSLSSHAEGFGTTASGDYSHAEGLGSVASGESSHANGEYTIAKGKDQTALGKFNIADTENKYAVIVGGGTADNARKNIFTIDWDGNVEIGKVDSDGNITYATINGVDVTNISPGSSGGVSDIEESDDDNTFTVVMSDGTTKDIVINVSGGSTSDNTSGSTNYVAGDGIAFDETTLNGNITKLRWEITKIYGNTNVLQVSKAQFFDNSSDILSESLLEMESVTAIWNDGTEVVYSTAGSSDESVNNLIDYTSDTSKMCVSNYDSSKHLIIDFVPSEPIPTQTISLFRYKQASVYNQYKVRCPVSWVIKAYINNEWKILSKVDDMNISSDSFWTDTFPLSTVVSSIISVKYGDGLDIDDDGKLYVVNNDSYSAGDGIAITSISTSEIDLIPDGDYTEYQWEKGAYTTSTSNNWSAGWFTEINMRKLIPINDTYDTIAILTTEASGASAIGYCVNLHDSNGTRFNIINKGSWLYYDCDGVVYISKDQFDAFPNATYFTLSFRYKDDPQSKSISITDIASAKLYLTRAAVGETATTVESGNKISLLPATSTTIGGVKPGNGLEILEDGTLNVTISGGGGTALGGDPSDGCVIKSFTYTGTGGVNNIQFPEKPVQIIDITGDAPSGTETAHLSAPVNLSDEYMCGIWYGSSSGAMYAAMSYNESTKVLTLSHSSHNTDFSVWNTPGKTFTVYYTTQLSGSQNVLLTKTITYIGNGSAENYIQFPEKPDFVLSMYGYAVNNYITAMPVEITSTKLMYQYGGGSNSGVGTVDMEFNEDNNILKLYNGYDTGAIFNVSGEEYIVRYLVSVPMNTLVAESSSSYTLPTASSDTLGGVKIGDGISIDDEGVISVESGVSFTTGDGLNLSDDNVLSVKIGNGLEISDNGTISVTATSDGDDSSTSTSSDIYVAGTAINIDQDYNENISVKLNPNMASYTDPCGEVIYSGEYAGRPAYGPFDGINSKTWDSHSWAENQHVIDGDPDTVYVGYLFGKSVKLNKFVMWFAADTAYGAIIQVRINNEWTTVVSEFETPTGYGNSAPQKIFNIDAVVCDGYRCCIISTSSNHPYFSTNSYGSNICEFEAWGYSCTNKINVEYGNGLIVNEDNELVPNLGDGLSIDEDGKINVTIENTSGSGTSVILDEGAGIDISTNSTNVYAVLEYLDTDGNQVIQTGLSTSGLDTHKIDIKYLMKHPDQATDEVLITIGALNYTDSRKGMQLYAVWEMSNIFKQSTSINNGSSWNHISSASTAYSGNIVEDTVIFTPNTEQSTYVPLLTHNMNNLANGEIILFATNKSVYRARSRIWYIKYYDDDVLTYEFIPVKRQSDGKIGILEKQTLTFLTNSYDSSDFVAGPLTGEIISDTPGFQQYTISNDGVLEIKPSTVKNQIIVTTKDGDSTVDIDVESGVSFTTGDGIELSDENVLSVKIGDGLSIDEDGTISVDTSDISSTTEVNVKPGEAIGFVLEEQESVPVGYNRIQYLETDGTQVFNTDYKVKPSTRVEMDVEVYDKSGTWTCLFGARNDSYSDDYHVFDNHSSGSGYAMGSETVIDKITHYSRLTIVFSNEYIEWTAHGSDLPLFHIDINKTGVTGSYPLYIFDLNNHGYVNGTRTQGKLYSFKIYENDELVRNYLPAVNSENTYGLYETKYSLFYLPIEGTITSVGPEMETSTQSQLINVKHGDGLTVNNNNELVVKLGNGLTIDDDGAIAVSSSSTPSKAPTTPSDTDEVVYVTDVKLKDGEEGILQVVKSDGTTKDIDILGSLSTLLMNCVPDDYESE